MIIKQNMSDINFGPVAMGSVPQARKIVKARQFSWRANRPTTSSRQKLNATNIKKQVGETQP